MKFLSIGLGFRAFHDIGFQAGLTASTLTNAKENDF